MNQNALVITNGCPENRIDSARIEQFLVQNGWIITQNLEESNLIIFNACGLTKDTQEGSINIIKKLKKEKNRNSELIVCGCLPRINKGSIQKAYNGNIFGSADIKKLANVLGIKRFSNNNHANYLIPRTSDSPPTKQKILNLLKLPIHYLIQTRIKKDEKCEYLQFAESVNIVQPNTFYIKVSSGCTNSCSYCAVKLSRGTIKSKSIEQIKKEFLKGLKLGYENFALIGTDTGSYGRDIQTDLVNLLREMISVDGKFWFRLRNVNPRALVEMLPGLLDVFKSGKIVHMTTAAQHGNNRILDLMKRGYKIEDFKFAVNALKNSCPKLKIRTQLMVGFPGETDSEFTDTVKLIDEIRFDFIETHVYSPRPNTLAAEMPNQVTRIKKRIRYTMLNQKVLDHVKAGAHPNQDETNDNFISNCDALLDYSPNIDF